MITTHRRISVSEIFKSVALKNYGNAMPQPPQHNSGDSVRNDLSDDKVYVLTGVNEMDDFLYDLACRRAMTVDIADSLLEERMCKRAIVCTDNHRTYPRVMKGLKVAFHDAASSANHDRLKRINDIHSALRAFLHTFREAST
ncbi:MAG: hypothetical protein E7Z68_01975 [Thermoplasmata archaeon]|nr:hypothetical protein [Thermoplasmata archaeon]